MAASSAATGADASAAGHIPVSSRGGPGSTTTSGPPGRCTTSPGAVPTGVSATAPRGTIACLRLAASSAGPAKPLRFAHPARIPAMCARMSSSSSSGAPAKAATTSPVRSSAVGPSPPEVTISATPASAANRSAPSRSPGRSPTIATCATSNPSRTSSRATNGPLRSAIAPVSSSLPVTTTAARGRSETDMARL